MNEQNIEDIISTLYDLIQDARAMPLASDKCIVERDKVLDMLDEIIAQMPVELKQARTIVESRNELIGQARREAETLVMQATEQAEQFLFSLGFSDFRIRMHHGDARLQLPANQLEQLLAHREQIIAELKKYYPSILLDLEVRP